MLQHINLCCTIVKYCNDLELDTLKQSKLSSLVESGSNVILGIVLSTIFTQVICMIYSIPLGVEDNLIITLWLTVISFIRQYAVRRFFNGRG